VFREIAEATLRYLGVTPSIPARSVGAPATQLAAFSQAERSASGGRAAVPDLRGLDARAAIARAVAAGLAVRAVGSGVVQTQKPTPGEALPDNRQITLAFGWSADVLPAGRGASRTAERAESALPGEDARQLAGGTPALQVEAQP